MKLNLWRLLPLMLFLNTSGCRLITLFVNAQPVVEFEETDFVDPAKLVEGEVRLYVPDAAKADLSRDKALLLEYAPVIVQGCHPDGATRADIEADFPGTPLIHTDGDDKLRVEVDTDRPMFYCDAGEVPVHGQMLKRLTYAYWYPRRAVGGIQEGHVDGGVFRVTLDAAGRPAIYEHAGACGCYHGVHVGEHLEAWAKESFGQPEKGKRYCVEKSVEGRIDIVVRDLVPGTDTVRRPVLFLAAGTHMCSAIRTVAVMKDWPALEGLAYGLADYDTLASLPLQDKPGQNGSMFDSRGLVWGGQRMGEELLFYGMDNPGWPRRKDKIAMHWDEVQWTDPALLETYFRLPEQIADPNAPLPK